jgi:competence protein ComEA
MMKPWFLILMGIFIGLLAAGLILLVVDQPHGQPILLAPPTTEAPLTIHVAGQVNQPGVYRVPGGSRVQDAIQQAGGFTAQADPQSVNLAALVVDGTKIIILPLPRPTDIAAQISSTPPALSIYKPLDVNTASVDMLDALPGIGPTKAQEIVTYRETHGAFTSLEDLLNIPGIGPAILDQIKPYLTIQPTG